MGASAAETPTSPDEQPVPGLRASDAERDEVAARLRDEFVAGRLSHDTFVHRINAVLESRRQADLPPLVADLPTPPQPGRPKSGWSRSAPPKSAPSGLALPQPGQSQPGQSQAARDQARQYYPVLAPGASALVVGRLRGAWSRVARQLRAGGLAVPTGPSSGAGATPGSPWPGRERGPWPRTPAGTASGGGGLVRGTMGMHATGDPHSPLSLQFPRGAGGEFSIGRDASCDLAIADMTVSRRHATLERTSDGWLLSDLESTNGTRVNGWRVRGKVAVRPGDLISFGNLVAVFAREDSVPPGAISPGDTPAPDHP